MVGDERGLVFPLGRGRQIAAACVASLGLDGGVDRCSPPTSAVVIGVLGAVVFGVLHAARAPAGWRARGAGADPDADRRPWASARARCAWDDVRAVGTLRQGPVQLIGIKAVNVRRGAFGRFNRRLPPGRHRRPRRRRPTPWCARSSPTWSEPERRGRARADGLTPAPPHSLPPLYSPPHSPPLVAGQLSVGPSLLLCFGLARSAPRHRATASTRPSCSPTSPARASSPADPANGSARRRAAPQRRLIGPRPGSPRRLAIFLPSSSTTPLLAPRSRSHHRVRSTAAHH